MKTLSAICIGTVIALLCISLTSSATTRYVSLYGAGQYTTIGAAYSAAATGDTILIAPGTYSESITSTKRLTWLGAGWDQSRVTGYLTSVASGTVIEGLRFEYSGGYVVLSLQDSVTVRRCFIKCNSSGSYAVSGSGRFFIEDCVLMQTANFYTVNCGSNNELFRGCVFAYSSSSSNSCFYGSSNIVGVLEVYNCVFVNYASIFNVPSATQPVIAVNNIFYDWRSSPSFGTYSPTSIFDYNASQTIAAPGTNTISITSNPFVNYNETNNFQEGISDLHLVSGSGLVDTGYPGWIDLDLSRSDFGVYGGPHPLVDNGVPPYPWTWNLTLSPNLVGQGTNVNASAIGRIGPQY